MSTAHANGVDHEPRLRATIPINADRPPPQNPEAEMGVLGAILMDNDVIREVIPILEVTDFHLDNHQIIYRTIRDLYDLGKPVDLIILAEELRQLDKLEKVGGVEILAQIAEGVPHAVNAKYYAMIVKELAIKRRVAEAANEITKNVYANRLDVEKIQEKAIRLIESASTPVFSRTSTGPHPWPEEVGEAAYHGPAGDIIRIIAPHTEADPMAILVQLLTAFGNLIGRGPHWKIEATRHGLNLFTCIVGNSSKARKGTSWDHVKNLLKRLDETWAIERIASGLSSGEGLIWSVRDPITKEGKEVDPGIGDKRLLAIESEFGGTLGMQGREGNTLSTVMREAWDSGSVISRLTKNSPARATGAHISVIGHITGDELERRLSRTDAANGYANRFLWVCARRSKCLPEGGAIRDLDFAAVRSRLAEAVEWARAEDHRLIRNDAAKALWRDVYVRLSEPKPGLLGSVTSRGEAQVMRLACIYAVLDTSPWVGLAHLEAALAVWGYCVQSAAYIFGASLGHPDAEKLLGALKEAGTKGLSRTQITTVFQKHRRAEEIDSALSILERNGLARVEKIPTGGAPREMWRSAGEDAK